MLRKSREGRPIFARVTLRVHCVFCAHVAFSVRTSRDCRVMFEIFFRSFPDGCALHLECTANCHRPQLASISSEVQCSIVCFFPMLCYSHALWQWIQGNEPLLPCQVETTLGTPTPIVGGCRLPGARCILHGLDDTIHGRWGVVLPMAAMYRHIAADHRIPGYELHGVLFVIKCGICGMLDAVAVATGKSAAIVVRNLFQPILDVARIQAQTVTKGRLNNDQASGKGNVRLECANHSFCHAFTRLVAKLCCHSLQTLSYSVPPTRLLFIPPSSMHIKMSASHHRMCMNCTARLRDWSI